MHYTIHNLEIWARVASNVISCFSYLLIGYTVFGWAHNRSTGHKAMMYAESAFFLVRACVQAVVAYRGYFNLGQVPLWISGLTCMVGLVLAIQVFAGRSDFMVTLVSSEKQDALLKEALADVLQGGKLLRFHAQLEKETTQTLMERFKNKGA